MRTLTLALGLLLSSVAFAAETPAGQAEMMKYMTPSEGHKKLAEMVGTWKYTMKMQHTADSKPEEMKGTSKAKLILGGRFLQEEVKAKVQGQTFEGINLTGYDNMKEAYQSIWIDNMATGMMTGEGKMADGKLTTEGTFSCPMTGQKERKYRSELVVTDKNNHIFSMYSAGTDGKEFKMMEIAYTRSK